MSDAQPTEQPPRDEPVNESSAADGALRDFADEVRAALDVWSTRLVQAVRSGRSATSLARMATARSQAEFRRLSLPEGGDASLRGVAGNYLSQAQAAVARAAHEIERNRYSLVTLQDQLEKLQKLYRQIRPEPDADQAEASAPATDSEH